MWSLSVLEIHVGSATCSLAFRLDKNCGASWSFVEVVAMFVPSSSVIAVRPIYSFSHVRRFGPSRIADTAAPLLIAEAPLATR